MTSTKQPARPCAARATSWVAGVRARAIEAKAARPEHCPAASAGIRPHGLLALLMLLASIPAAAVEDQAERIGLVLGGGGARGAAHVGVLKVLEREGIAVDFIAGTSMGAIVGALYASGHRPDEIEAILESIDWAPTLRDQPARPRLSMQRKQDMSLIPSSLEVGIGRDGIRLPRGLLQGQNFGLLLRQHLLTANKIEHFDELPIPFRAIAADVVSGQQVVLDSGDLVAAVRASMSVPGVFQPTRVDGRLLVDGGVVNNVPVDVVRAMGATRLIVVNVGEGLAEEADLNSPAAMTMQVISILMARQTADTLAELGEQDILIEPDLGDLGSAEFHRSLKAVPLGESAAEAAVERLRALRASPDRWEAFAQRARLPDPASERIDRVSVDDSRSRTALRVQQQLRRLEGQNLDPAAIDAAIAEAYGDGRHERIGYLLETDDDGQQVLRISPVDKGWGPHFLRLGLSLSDDFDGDSRYQLDALARVASELSPGAEWRMRLGVGDRNEIDLGWLSPLARQRLVYLHPSVGIRAIDQPLFVDDDRVEFARLRWTRRRIGTDLGVDWDSTTRGYVRLERGRDRLSRQVGPSIPRLGQLTQNYGFVGLGLLRDSLDDATFPTRGGLIDARLEWYRGWLGSDQSTSVLRLDMERAFSFNRYIGIGGLRAVSARDDAASLQALEFLGGLGNLSGFTDRALSGSQVVLARGLLMRRLGEQQALFSLPAYAGISLEAGNAWSQRSDVSLDDLIIAGSVYLGVSTPLGPVFFGYGRSSEDSSAIYLKFGSLVRPMAH